jgi:hypothetical protein
MICPICKEQGLKSTVTTQGGGSTLMGYTPYYDESGRLHHHDNNTRSTLGNCSQGHSFHYIFENSCWCGWKGIPEQFKMLDKK